MGAVGGRCAHRTRTSTKGNNVSEHSYHRVPGDVLAERNATAERVCRELRMAGLRAFRSEEGEDHPEGAQVTVDPGADAAGGVFVDWKCPLGRAAAASMMVGILQAPVIQQHGAVARHMQRAITGILEAAGLVAWPSDDDLNPTAVHVATG